MKNIIKIFKSKYITFILLLILITVQLLRVGFVIVNEKEGYHSDEILTYGLSNSFFKPFIQADRYMLPAEDFDNVNEWTDGQKLRDYVAVQEDQRFRYDSVWYNQEKDRHPPLHYSVIHTISSFFPDTFTPVFGYAVNFICFAVLQIYLYKLSKILLKSRWLALLVCFGWGFCSSALNTVVFIRMYCMLAMFMVIFMYIHADIAERVLKNVKFEKDKTYNLTKKDIIGLVTITALGALTQHMFLIMSFFTAVFFCIWLLFEKRVKTFLQYGFSVLGGAVISIAVFPGTFSHLLGEGANNFGSDMFLRQIGLSIKYFVSGCFSLRESVVIKLLIYLLTAIFTITVFSIPIIYLFRDRIKPKEKLHSFKENAKKYFSELLKSIKSITPKKVIVKLRSLNPMTLIIFLVCSVIVIITSYTINFMITVPVDRYYFIIFPSAFVMTVSALYFILSRVPFRKQILSVLLAVIFINIVLNSKCTYLYKNSGTLESISDITAGSSVIVVEENPDEDWLINTLPPEMYDVGQIFMTNVDDIKNYTDKLNDFHNKGNLYVMLSEPAVYGETMVSVDEDKLREQLDFYKSADIINDLEYIGTYEIFTRTYQIYKCT